MRSRLAWLLIACLAALSVSQAHAEPKGRQVIRRVFNPAKKTQLPASWTIGGNSYVSQSEYKDLKGGVMELLRRYPPDKFFFVGLGRDPAPVIAFLQNLGEKNLAVNLPGTSNIGWSGQVGDEDVARYIEGAIPPHILKGERTIVVLDVTSTGKTPAVFGPYLDRYLQQRGNTKRVVKLAFSWGNVMQGGYNTGQYAGHITDWIDTKNWPDYQQYYGGKYENGVSEHERTMMARGGSPPTAVRPAYKQFRDALYQRMEQDPELDSFISRIAKDVPPLEPPPPPKPWPARVAFKRDGQNAATGAQALFSVKEKVKEKKEKKEKKVKPGKAPKVEEDGDEADRPGSYDYLSQAEYGQLRNGALAIMKQAPPSKNYYVGVGRSAGPLVAFFETLGDDFATYLPADGLQKLAKGKHASRAPEALDTLFDTFLPKQALSGARDIVLFQRSESGTSLPFMQQALTSYLMRRGSPTQVQILSLAESKPAQGDFLDISRAPELKALNDRKYRLVSPYDYFRPGHDDISEVVNDNNRPAARSRGYLNFKRGIEQRMNGDSTLDPIIRASGQ